METGFEVLPHFKQDTTDRLRTSPFAFTGNTFELRMLGSSLNIACPNLMLNTIAAEWIEEAGRRGLLNLKSMPEAVLFREAKNLDLFARHRIFSEAEMRSRYEIQLETYAKVLRIEAITALETARQEIFPAVSAYKINLCDAALACKALAKGLHCTAEITAAQCLSADLAAFYAAILALEQAAESAQAGSDALARARAYMTKRSPPWTRCAQQPTAPPSKDRPYPSYGALLLRI